MANKVSIAVILNALDKMSPIINGAVSRAQSKLQTLSRNADAFAGKAFKNGRDLAAMGTASAMLLAAPVKEAMAFETKMVDIRKQMQEDTPKFVKQMTDDIFKMGRELPLATGEIQEMIASSLRMGVAQDQVVKFTRDVTKMSVAFDMVPAEIADSMGKIANVYKIPIQEIGKFADVINYLDDNTMAKGPELIGVLQRIGGTSKYFKPASAAALASTMLSLGESEETAGTSINALVNKLGTATMGTKKFQEGLSMIGVNASTLQKRMSNVATSQEAIMDVLGRINKLDPAKQNEVLVRLFGLEHGPKLAKLTNNVKEFERQLALVQGQEKGSMDKEYQKRIQTSTAQWQLFKNRLTEVSVTAGTSLLPALNQVMQSAGKIVQKISDFASRNPELISSLGKAVAVFSALSFAASGLSFMIGGIAKGISLASSGISIGIKVFQGLSTTMKVVGTVMNVLRMAFLTNPIGLIIAGIAVAALLIIKYWTPIKEFFLKIWNSVKGYVMPIIDFLKNLFLNFTPIGLIIKHWNKIVPFFKAIWDNIKAFFELGITIIKVALLKFTPLGLIVRNWSAIKGFFVGFWNYLKQRFMDGVNFVKSVFLNFTPIGLIIKHWDQIKSIFSKAVAWVMNIGKKFYDAGANIIGSIINGITSKINLVSDKIKGLTQKIRNYFPFSPAKEGPLRDIHKIKLVETIAQTIRPNALAGKMQQMVGAAIAPGRVGTISTVSNNRNSSGEFTFNITLNGSATKEDAANITGEIKKQFSQWMRDYNNQQKRVGF